MYPCSFLGLPGFACISATSPTPHPFALSTPTLPICVSPLQVIDRWCLALGALDACSMESGEGSANASLACSAGQLYEIRLEYKEVTDMASVKVRVPSCLSPTLLFFLPFSFSLSPPPLPPPPPLSPSLSLSFSLLLSPSPPSLFLSLTHPLSILGLYHSQHYASISLARCLPAHAYQLRIHIHPLAEGRCSSC